MNHPVDKDYLDARLETMTAATESRIEAASARVDARMEAASAAVDARIADALARTDARLAGAEAQAKARHAEAEAQSRAHTAAHAAATDARLAESAARADVWFAEHDARMDAWSAAFGEKQHKHNMEVVGWLLGLLIVGGGVMVSLLGTMTHNMSSRPASIVQPPIVIYVQPASPASTPSLAPSPSASHTQ